MTAVEAIRAAYSPEEIRSCEAQADGTVLVVRTDGIRVRFTHDPEAVRRQVEHGRRCHEARLAREAEAHPLPPPLKVAA